MNTTEPTECDDLYPVRVGVEFEAGRSRLTNLLRLPLAAPRLIATLLLVLGIVPGVWATVLVTGRHRRGSVRSTATSNSTHLIDDKIHGVGFGEVSIRFDVRGQLRTNSRRVVLPCRLTTHAERFADLLPRRPRITSGFDLRPTDRFQLRLATRQLPKRSQRIRRQGINRNNTHECQDNLTEPTRQRRAEDPPSA